MTLVFIVFVDFSVKSKTESLLAF